MSQYEPLSRFKLVVLLWLACGPAVAQQLTLLSAPENPLVLGPHGNAAAHSCRLGGTDFVVFTSSASNLVGDDTNAGADIFLRSRTTGELERISVDSQGNDAVGDSFTSDVSDDGRYVVFSSNAPLAQGVAAIGPTQIFLRDRSAGSTILLSRSATAAGNGESANPRINASGTQVVFQSSANNLVGSDNNDCADIFVYDLVTETLTRVSTSGSDDEANNCSHDPDIADDGISVVFSSDASNLVANDIGHRDVFRKDIFSGAIERLSVGPVGENADRGSGPAVISDDGSTVVFATKARNLLAADTNLQADIYVAEPGLPLARISSANDGSQSNAPSSAPTVNADGRQLAFDSGASNLVAGQTQGSIQPFFADRDALEPLSALLSEQDQDAMLPVISADGTLLCVQSDSALLPADLTPRVTDIYSWQPGSGQLELESVASSPVPTASNGASRLPELSTDGRYVVFQADAFTLDAEQTEHSAFDSVYWLDRQTGAIERYPIGASNLAPNGSSFDASVSGDGRFIAYATNDFNAIAGDGDANTDVVRLDRLSQDLNWISSLSLSADSDQPQISDDGARVIFRSASDNLVAGDSNQATDIFLWQDNDPMARLSVSSTGAQANEASYLPRLSSSGAVAVFVSDADNLVATDSNDAADVFVRDIDAGTTVRASITSSGEQADGASHVADVSGNGQLIALITDAENISNFSRIGPDVIRWDRITGVALNASALLPFDEDVLTDWVRISDDGRFIAYTSERQAGSAFVSNLWRFDVVNQQLDLISSNDGVSANFGDIAGLSISGTGQILAFASDDDSLLPDDSNGSSDIFLADLRGGPGVLGFVSANQAVNEGDGEINLLITREAGTSGVVSISYDTFPGSAFSGQDFTSKSGIVSFGDGESIARSFSIPIVDNDEFEGDEQFTIALSDPQGGASLGPFTLMTVTIVDDDTPPDDMFSDGFE